VAGTGSLSGVRKSTRGKWRAAVLIGLHLLIAAHAAHFLMTGRTLSPVEPSESMYTLELGYVNAGFVFFAAALLATVIFGRFVCGWGCHMVALQDLCGWFMRKLGIRPRPFRSRLLMWVPLGLALYMFVWPTVKRVFLSAPHTAFAGFTDHLLTTGFWDTFPGPWFAVLTLATCGFATVYFLGSKGFCTYGCPYGGFFVLADRLSPARIVVNDACEQCGHCTATCTSNVRVHEEVRLYGMVVDPGCMKCTDCVSVCPNDALSYGFAKPSVLKGAPAAPARDVRYTLTVGEEILVGVVFLASMLAFRGLYDGPPLLMAVGLGGITAFAALKLWHLYRRPTVRVQNVVLEMDGKIRGSGWVFAAVTVAWLLFTAHSGFVQWHRALGSYWLQQTEATRADVLSGAYRTRRYSGRHQDAAARSFGHFGQADRWGLVDVAEVKLGLAWGHLLSNDPDSAEAEVRAAIAVAPENRRPSPWLPRTRLFTTTSSPCYSDSGSSTRPWRPRGGASRSSSLPQPTTSSLPGCSRKREPTRAPSSNTGPACRWKNTLSTHATTSGGSSGVSTATARPSSSSRSRATWSRTSTTRGSSSGSRTWQRVRTRKRFASSSGPSS